MFYLGQPASGLDPDKVSAAIAALARMEHQLAMTPFLVGDALSSPTSRFSPIPASRHEGGFHLDGYAAVRRWIGAMPSERSVATGALNFFRKYPWPQLHPSPFARARRDDVGIIVHMLADDPLGSARERIEDPMPASYFRAFETLDRDPNIRLVVAEDGEGAVVGCLAALRSAGAKLAGASRGLIEDVRVAKHCRSRGVGEQMVQWALAQARKWLHPARAAHASHRVDAQRSMNGSDFSAAMSE
jgi:GNAT superfamily N-acetyltransferase